MVFIGMTNSNYTELNELYKKYKDKGLEILAFPCNQFGEEEPGSNEQITDYDCTRFKSEFQIFNKIEVNGEKRMHLLCISIRRKGNGEYLEMRFNGTLQSFLLIRMVKLFNVIIQLLLLLQLR